MKRQGASGKKEEGTEYDMKSLTQSKKKQNINEGEEGGVNIVKRTSFNGKSKVIPAGNTMA